MIVSAGIASHPPTTEFQRADDFPFWTAGIVLRGSTRYSASGRVHVTTGPSLQVIPPGTSYRLSNGAAAGPWVEAWAVFTPPTHWNPLLDLPEALPGIRSLTISPTAAGRSILREAIHGVRMVTAAPRWRNQVVASVAERILLLAQLQRGAPGDPTGPPLDQRVRQIEIAILADPGRRWTVATLAGISHLSPSRFAHLFTQQVGMPPRRYIERARMERACELLLSTNTSVQEIARAVGYESPLHFSARFKSLTTKAPTEFRRHPRA